MRLTPEQREKTGSYRWDATDEVRKDGRSAVLRRAAAEYLVRRERAEVRERYERAYGELDGLGDEFGGWEEEGVWPAD